MTSLINHRWVTVGLGLGLSIAICGCAVGSKGASIDSSSKMPWFNLELKERKKKQDGPAFRSVNLDKKGKSRIEAVASFDGQAQESTSVPRKASTALPLSEPATPETKVADSSSDFDFR